MRHDALERRLGYRFRDAGLLDQALTHRSFGTPNNERLEFLGDAVLNCAVAQLLYAHFDALSEGDLSRVRANLVNQESLHQVAADLDLGAHILLGEGEVKSGGARRPSILADALEAILGAILLDGGFDDARRVVAGLFDSRVRATDPTSVVKDPKTRLQEFLQGRRIALPQYTVVDVSGEAHEQLFRVECSIPELRVRSFGEGPSRRAAEQNAARSAFEEVASTH